MSTGTPAKPRKTRRQLSQQIDRILAVITANYTRAIEASGNTDSAPHYRKWRDKAQDIYYNAVAIAPKY